MMLRVAVGILVLAIGAGLGFVASGAGGSTGTVITGKPLPAVTTIATTPQTIAKVPALQTTTTSTVPKTPRQVTNTKTIIKNVSKP
jgi:hypothetical protein